MAAQPVSSPQSMPPPIGGWNARDQFDAMDPTDAVQLDNWFPDAGGVSVRRGFQSYATNVGSAAVATLAEFNSGGTRKFLAASSGHIWDISVSGSSPTSLGSGFTSDQWQTVNFLNRTFFMNGVNTMQVFDGTTLGNATFTGVTLSTLVGGWQYQQGLYFWQNNSTGFWYSQLNSISGTLSFFDLAPFSPNGGNVVAITSITHDGGNGVLDFLAVILSSGDTLLYYGNDPSQLQAWQLVGRYRLSPPVSPRAVTTYGGDSFITTYDDHVMIEQQLVALKVGSLPPRSKVSTAVQMAVQANKGAFGWQALYYPRGRALIFNIPNTDGTFDQHVCNTGLPAQPWCRYTGMNAHCWGLFKDQLYFGAADGIVYQADIGHLDGLGAILATAQQAWNKLASASAAFSGMGGNRKRVTAGRPVVQSVGGISYNFSIGFDYNTPMVEAPISSPAIGSPWDTSPWDTSPWSNDYQVSTIWHACGGSGTAISWAISIGSTEQTSWLRTDFRVEQGIAL
jgi:hypothetical protein